MVQIEIKLGDVDASRRLLLTLLKNYPGFEWIDYAYYLLGCSDYESKKFGLAENSFRKVSLLSKKKRVDPRLHLLAGYGIFRTE